MSRSTAAVPPRALALLLAAAALGSACQKSEAPPPSTAAPAGLARELPPAPAEPRPVSIPAASEKTLDNGLRVIVVARHGSPLVTAELNVLSGGEVDPEKLPGLADFTAALLTQGTKTRSAPQIAQAAEALGGSLAATADWNVSRAGITVTTPKAAAALALLADVVRNPLFAKTEVERQRAQALDSLRVSLSQPRTLASLVATRLAYGNSPYGHPRMGTPRSLAHLEPADLKALHARYYRPDNAVLLFAGDIDADDAFALAEKSFGGWTRPKTALPKTTATASDDKPAGADTEAAAAAPRVIVVDMPDAGQAAVVAIHKTEARAAGDYYAGLITNAVLGGGYSARLNEEIRIKRGLSYGAGSRLQALRDDGSLLAAAQTKNPSAAQVVDLILGELGKLSSETVPAAELKARKASLIGNFSRSLETTDGLASQLGSRVTLGIDLDEINHSIESANAITADQVQAYAKAHLDKSGTDIVVAGDTRKFLDALRKTYPQLEVIEAGQLNLDRADLGLAKTATES